MIRLLYGFLSNRKLSTLHRIGAVLGSIIYYLTPSRRKVVEKNCSAIGIEPSARHTKQIYINSFKSFMEFFYVNNINESFIANHVECENDKALFDILDKEDAIFAVSGHLGAWEFLTPILSRYFKVTGATVGRRIKNPAVDELVSEVRSLHNNTYIKHRNAVPHIMKALNDGISIGALLDHSATPKSAIYVDLFGHKTSFIAGIPMIAAKKNITIVPIFVVRENGNYQIKHYPPIMPNKKLKPKERILQIARDINKVYEDIIPKYHDQWFMLHKRFKRTENANGKVTNDFYR
jgi:KDO2-lipid IV(A) lauroyltransferase